MAMEDKDIIQLFFDRNEQAIEETSMKWELLQFNSDEYIKEPGRCRRMCS